MAEGRGNENTENYPDSLNSSPRSRDTDPDCFGGGNQRWDAVDSGGATGGGGRVRLMCSCGGKILPRPHDNQLTYAGGDTRILAVDRHIRFNSMIAKLASLWGTAVSFKYQLPNEDLDALVSVTNEEDLENMMAEYDRLLKSGYKFSRLRLFAFPRDSGSGTSSLGSSVMEDSGRREQWFVEALNAHPPVTTQAAAVGRPEAETTAWVNNMPDYLFGLENTNAGDEDPKQKQGNETADARVGGSNNSTRPYEETTRVAPEPARTGAERVPNVNYREGSKTPPPAAPPVQELQKMQIKQQPAAPPPDPAPVPVAPPAVQESQRKMYSPPEVPRTTPEPAYQNPASDYYAQEIQQPQLPAHGHFNPQPLTYWQMHDHTGAGVYLVPSGQSGMMQPVRAPAGYYNPSVMPRMNLPQPVYEACPPVPTVRPMAAAVQRQNPSDVGEQYREAQAAAAAQQPVVGVSKIPAMYGPPGAVGGMMYRAGTPVQVATGHPQEAYSYGQQQQHMMYDVNPPRQVYYTQAVNPAYQAVGPVSADLHGAPTEMTGNAPEQGQAPPPQVKLGRV